MGFTRSLAVSLAPTVRVNCIAPGWIRTAWGEQASAMWQERVVRETPLARWGRPEDVAWLAHAAHRADHVVITQKDAVKLRDRWPHAVPEPLVAMLDLVWEEGGYRIAAALDAVVTPVEHL